ncbi:protein of unknown function [Clostridium beijerinckii]|nr:protein of unknown function [Clostridium beijerinckii]
MLIDDDKLLIYLSKRISKYAATAIVKPLLVKSATCIYFHLHLYERKRGKIKVIGKL